MTREEFRTWTKDRAENLQLQRDDAIARIEAADAECLRLTAELQATKDLLADAESRIAAMSSQIEAMACHPDVVASKRQARIGELRRLKELAAQADEELRTLE